MEGKTKVREGNITDGLIPLRSQLDGAYYGQELLTLTDSPLCDEQVGHFQFSAGIADERAMDSLISRGDANHDFSNIIQSGIP